MPSTQDYKHLEQKLQVPMFVISLVYLILFALQTSTSLSPAASSLLDFFDIIIWLIFVVEYLLLLFLSQNKHEYIAKHFLNLLIVIVPSFRLLRVLSLFEIMGIDILLLGKIINVDSKIASAFVFFANTLTYIKKLITRDKIHYIFIFVIFLVVFLGSMASLFERDIQGANITSTSEGIWWGITSITTVGYGDRYPVTWAGRIIGIMLMTLGVTLFSLLTAEMSSVIIGRQENKDKKEILKKLEEVQEEIKSLKTNQN